MQLRNTVPDFALLFLKGNWQPAYKQLLRQPLAARGLDEASQWVAQAAAGSEVVAFDAGFFSGPVVDFTSLRAETLAELARGATAGQREQVNTLTFFRENLAVFPEPALKRIPAPFFSEALIGVLRQPPLD